jgi:hypothetical protein
MEAVNSVADLSARYCGRLCLCQNNSSAALSPLNALLSHPPCTPGHAPRSVYCQSDHVGHALGSRDGIAVVVY